VLLNKGGKQEDKNEVGVVVVGGQGGLFGVRREVEILAEVAGLGCGPSTQEKTLETKS